ncbi:hypothetical protein [Natrinema sp. DC36]|uniref:hypothetical protein n=1 Tax=Natrinema sp. DC36 TaxID=2878680 RepID=UPI001CF0764B|nr:hypothetical protein [Natrinema sp. DC36]
MPLPNFAITSDAELEEAARDKTSYNDSVDEWPSAQASGNIDDAKRVLYMKTHSQKWYSDVAYGQALVALTAMKAKEAVENVNITSYGIGDEQVAFSNANPETSQQIISWSGEVNDGIEESELDFDGGESPSFSNTASYIG